VKPYPWQSTKPLFWRLDAEVHADRWDQGIGAQKVGGRWNPRGYPAVYGSIDPATAILEVAVHKGFETLDRVPHVLTCAEILHPESIHVVRPSEVPNTHWLGPGFPSDAQQRFGRARLESHAIVAVPSVTAAYCWNLVFNPARAAGQYELRSKSRFALDPRLNPPV
jgi:RES domain-containing protein